MKNAYTITNKKIIKNILDEVEFGTLALCNDNRPYSLPLNFVELKGEIYFHGAQKGKKIDLIRQNRFASFSVVESYSVLPSYFSTSDNSACPATHMFKSVIIDGEIKLVEEYDEKAEALNELMKKLQSEGKYIPLHDKIYEKIIDATALFKLVPNNTTCKVKFGQNFSKERYERVSKYLKQRGTSKDMATLDMINEFRNDF